jgi:hypothetical protein
MKETTLQSLASTSSALLSYSINTCGKYECLEENLLNSCLTLSILIGEYLESRKRHILIK